MDSESTPGFYNQHDKHGPVTHGHRPDIQYSSEKSKNYSFVMDISCLGDCVSDLHREARPVLVVHFKYLISLVPEDICGISQ